MTSFVGASAPLTMNGFHNALDKIGVQAAELWAVIGVETSGCGYFDNRSPQILFERHIFYKLTNGKFPVSDINSPDAGGYASGADEYTRLARAAILDQDAALQSASWGIGQILGENHAAAGFPDAASMVAAMVAGEDGQVMAMVNFLVTNGLDRALRNHDWAGFARGYNGPNYSKYSYDTKLLQNYQRYSVGSLPDLTIRAAQLILTFLNFHPGGVDGVNGLRTESAIKAFQTSSGLPATGLVDGATSNALIAALSAQSTASAAG